MCPDIILGSPFPITGYKPWSTDFSQSFDPGVHDVPVNFHLEVPVGQRYTVNVHIEVTGVV